MPPQTTGYDRPPITNAIEKATQAMQKKATDEQIVEALQTMSGREAAKHLGLSPRQFWQRKASLVRRGYSPERFALRCSSDMIGKTHANSLRK